MLWLFISILIELLILYLISRRLTQGLFEIALRLTRSPQTSIGFVTLLLFPGTIIHELSHLFTAEVLGVRTGQISLVPEIPSKLEQGKSHDIRTGGVQIAKTGPLRRYVIGIAPIIVGIIVLSAISYLVLPYFDELKTAIYNLSLPPLSTSLILFVTIYLLFSISNSMFSSPTDLEGFWAVTIVFGLIFGALYWMGLRFELTGAVLEITDRILTSLSQSLGVVLIINMLFLAITSFFIRNIKK